MNQQGHTEWIKNPKTNRLIILGGKTWRSLVKEGIIKGVIENRETKILETKDELLTVLEPIKEEKSNNRKDKLIFSPPTRKGKKQNRLAQQEITELSTKSAIEIIKQNSEALAEELENIAYIEDETEYTDRMALFEKRVEQMIYQQLLTKKKNPRVKKEPVDYDTEYSIVE